MRPADLKTKIFLDSGDPQETEDILNLLGFLDGQTTNPSLFAKNPEVRERMKSGKKYGKEEVYNEYKKIVKEISALLTAGSVSVEVYADANISVQEILKQAREMNSWIPNAHIKLPITRAGLEAAEILIKENVRLNMTLVFSQEQAAAVYSVTRGTKKGDVFLSPFIGRFDDRGEDGMSFIANVIKMYKLGDGHTEILSASVRTYQHFLRCLQLQSDIVTAPGKILNDWAEHNFEIPDVDWRYDAGALKSLPYEEVSLNLPWQKYNIKHELTDKGLEKFAEDWNFLVS